jgi:N6-adenosine-specific RNA methylase IME4
MVPPENTPRLEDLCLTKKESADAQFLATVAKDKPEMYGAIRRRELSIPKARRECQREATIIKLTRIAAQSPADISGRFDVIVCDPPWPVEKIERDVAPNQVALDYPTMSLGELAEWPGVVDKAEPNCHLWLWTTPKFLPNAIELVKEWGFSYVCCHVWHKPGGFQPFGLPQYNCEFAVYARKGSPLFKETKDFPLCFTAPRTGHSEKPDAFYERVRRVTAGRRLDMFNRRRIPGFIGWGNEAPICKADAWMHGQFQPQRSSE